MLTSLCQAPNVRRLPAGAAASLSLDRSEQAGTAVIESTGHAAKTVGRLGEGSVKWVRF